jgi:hypothetical protein
MSLRCSFVSRVFAVWFMVLIVLPFTAPFQAWDPAAPISKASSQGLRPTDKLSADAALAALAPSVAPSTIRVIVRARKTSNQTARHCGLQTVLRV